MKLLKIISITALVMLIGCSKEDRLSFVKMPTQKEFNEFKENLKQVKAANGQQMNALKADTAKKFEKAGVNPDKALKIVDQLIDAGIEKDKILEQLTIKELAIIKEFGKIASRNGQALNSLLADRQQIKNLIDKGSLFKKEEIQKALEFDAKTSKLTESVNDAMRPMFEGKNAKESNRVIKLVVEEITTKIYKELSEKEREQMLALHQTPVMLKFRVLLDKIRNLGINLSAEIAHSIK